MKIIHLISRISGYVATITLGLMMLLTVADVSLRYFFNAPITGTTEITQLMMVVVVFLALAWCASNGAHVRVDLLVGTFRPRTRAIFDSITLMGALFIYVIITWRSWIESGHTDTTTSLVGIPLKPFHYILTIGFGLLVLVIVTLIIDNVKKAVKR